MSPVGLSLEDVAALLFWWAVTDEELADDSYVRLLVAETVINLGSGQIEELRCQLGEQTRDASRPPYLAYCRDWAAAVFRAHTAARPGSVPWRGCAELSTALKAARHTAGWTRADPPQAPLVLLIVTDRRCSTRPCYM